MQKIASPQDLQTELRRLLAYCQGPRLPSRERLASELRGLADRVAGDTRFWVEQFKSLDKALPRYDSSTVTDWNKVMKHYRASGLRGRDAGRPAHWYQEYRTGNMTLEDAAKAISRELPNAENVLGRPL